MTGQTILNYKILSVIGEGGMGTVFLGQHITLNRKVAIKMLRRELAVDNEIKKRFINEAQLLSELNHNNIVKLYDFTESQNDLYLIMEFVEGSPLDNFIEKINGPIDEQNALKIFIQILEGFAYAHSKGIVHRDIKPSNIILKNDHTPKILDFGIAKIVESDVKITKTGMRIGSVVYMSPEQILGRQVDFRSDIYSLGLTLFEMLSGKLPYNTTTASEYEIQTSIVNEPIPSVKERYPYVSDRIDGLIKKAMDKNPANRFQSCNEFIHAIKDQNYICTNENQFSKTEYAPQNYNAGASAYQRTSLSGTKPKNNNKTIMTMIVGALIFVVILGVLGIVFKDDIFYKEPEKLKTNTITKQQSTPEQVPENDNPSGSGNSNNNQAKDIFSTTTPEDAARSFVNALGQQNFNIAWEIIGGNSWGAYSKFSSTKGYGGISKTYIYECKKISENGNNSTVYIDYDSYDPYNNDGRYKQNFIMKKSYDGWHISKISNVSKTIYR